VTAEQELPHMYGDLAGWFQLLSAPQEYEEEAAFYLDVLIRALGRVPRSVLELGSGAGNNAFNYKSAVESVTLSDLSSGMLALSRRLNPECEHIQGDMRSLRLERAFEAVFVHDAVCYMTSAADLEAAMTTAYVHCAPALAPDHVRESFAPSTDHGGNDGADGRALRYLEWTRAADPSGSSYEVDYAYLLSEAGQPTRAVYDRHVCGLFSRADWLRLLEEVGFQASVVPFEHSEVAYTLDVFVGVKPLRLA
jgi:SAM-dependent methyltransferase